MIRDAERREVAARLRKNADSGAPLLLLVAMTAFDCPIEGQNVTTQEAALRLAELIEPSYKPDAEYEAWYDGLSHSGDGRGGPAKIRELIEEIVWTALTVDLGPNGNTDQSTGIDEGDAYTGELFDYWESEVLRLTGGCDRDELLWLAGEMDVDAGCHAYVEDYVVYDYARRIRKALGVQDA